MTRLAYLGPAGTFSEDAALRYAPHAELVALPSITAAAQAVPAGEADEAIVPIENSLAGAVTETLDLLVHLLDLRISAEVVVPIVHSLVVGPETRLQDVGVVLSHPQPLLQCRSYLERELPGVRTEAALSTAEAVERIVARGDAAAIAPRRAADLHGGVVLEEGIEDDHRNATRFVVLTTQDAEPSGDDKTSLMFSVRDEPGALVRILQSFAEAGVNLTKIESLPAREALGVYIFLVDCDGHRAQPPLREILEQLRPKTSELKVVGSYPRFQE